jgi:putative transposase
MEVMPDHVHLFMKTTPTNSLIVQQLKGYTSRVLREEFPFLKSRLPFLWTRSYYCESVGHISEETIRRYIEDQKGK